MASRNTPCMASRTTWTHCSRRPTSSVSMLHASPAGPSRGRPLGTLFHNWIGKATTAWRGRASGASPKRASAIATCTARRSARAAVRDIEDMADEFGLAHIGRGLDFESSIERSLATDGLDLGGTPWEDVGGGGRGTVRFYLDPSTSADALAPVPPGAPAPSSAASVTWKRRPRPSSIGDRGGGRGTARASGGRWTTSTWSSQGGARGGAQGTDGAVPADARAGEARTPAKPPRETGADIHYAHRARHQPAPPHAGSAVTLIVIDAKATDHVKLGARVQVAFYSLALKELLRHFVARRRRDASPPRPPLVMAGSAASGSTARPRRPLVSPTSSACSPRDVGQATADPDEGARAARLQDPRWHLNHCFGCEYLKDRTKEASKRAHGRGRPMASRT